MAPEVLDGKVSYTHKADCMLPSLSLLASYVKKVFSFGMIVFHMLFLEVPYRGCSLFETTKSILNGIPPKPSQALKGDYEVLVNLHSQLTNHDPNARPDLPDIIARLKTFCEDGDSL